MRRRKPRPAGVFKPSYTRRRDGKRRPSPNYHIEFRDLNDIRRRVVAFTDKAASAEFGRRIDGLVGLRATKQTPGPEAAQWLDDLSDYHREKFDEWGLIDVKLSLLSDLLTGHVDDYRDAIIAKGKTRRTANQNRTRVLAIFDGCDFKHWSDINVGKIMSWLATQRAKGMKERTSCHYVTAIKGFGNWMVADGRAAASPLARLKGVTVTDEDERGFLLADQMQTLLTHTATGTKRAKLSGPDRALIYRFAVETGLRAGAIRSLTRPSFKFDRDADGRITGGTVTVAAGHQKNRTKHEVPLRPDLASTVADHVSTLHPGTPPVFRRLPDKTVPMLHADLEAAGLPTVDENGHRIDFHSLRHTCATWLMAEGVDVLTVCAITGHKDPAMVLKRYGHAMKHKTREAVAKLPALRMTGTDGDIGPCQQHENLGATNVRQGTDGNPGLCAQYEISDDAGNVGATSRTRNKPPDGLEPSTCGLQNRCSSG